MRGSCSLLVLAVVFCAVAQAETTIPWDQAAKHVGEETTIEGRVLGVHCSPPSCLLAFEPSFNGFTAVIQAASFDVFPPGELDKRYSGRRVRVHGKIETRDGKPEIVVAKSEDLALVPGKKRDEPYERLRTVKRGMSRAEVQRLVGEPTYVENGSGGWTTWYYGYGRSVSFDRR